MISLIEKLFDKHTWLNLLALAGIAVIGMAAAVGLTYYFPISFEISTNEIRDQTYALHTVTYRTWSTVEKHSAVVHLKITDSIRTVQNNLVEKKA